MNIILYFCVCIVCFVPKIVSPNAWQHQRTFETELHCFTLKSITCNYHEGHVHLILNVMIPNTTTITSKLCSTKTITTNVPAIS